MRPPPAEGWRGFHLFYHGDQDRLLTDLVGPLAASLLMDGLIRRFFCIRYSLGGPHVRLRMELDAANAPTVAARVHDAAAAFFARRPSTESLPEERIHQLNRGIIADDPFADEADDLVLPDNSVVEFPVHIEVDRYGGPALYGHSLDFFAISTLEALRFLEVHAGRSAGRRMAGVVRLLVQQAWGHAGDAEEFVPLASYAVGTLGARLAGLVSVADAAFERGHSSMCALVRAELAALAEPGEGPALTEAARALAHVVRGAPGRERRMIATGQMHMTANRLGLLNGEEVYLCRILARTLEAVAEADPDFWSAVWKTHRERTGAPVWPLHERVPAALVEFAGGVTAGGIP